ncbi:MAG: chorismate mutase [Coleofasciculaceae cyanobacterium SM2_1_6]|nr:chorismate mutase [Coleofasciculaceae cyanobacterium SM2_1_6]
MPPTPELINLAHCLTGEFSNQEQALAEPAWYVHLRLWHRPVVGLFSQGLTIFAEQANILKLDQPYRQRLLQLQEVSLNPLEIQVQYYKFLDPGEFRGAGANPSLLKKLTLEKIELLPGCVLGVSISSSGVGLAFEALPMDDRPCSFSYDDKVYQVRLGFATRAGKFLSYDQGIDPTTGKAIWGAMLGAYCFQKTQEFTLEVSSEPP